MSIDYQELYQWKYSKDANVMLVFLWLVAHSKDYKVECSLRTIASDTGVSFQAVRTAINKMISDGTSTHESTHQKSTLTIWRFVSYTKSKPTRATHKSTHKNVDLVSFVQPEHLDMWNEWLKYRSSIRKQFANTSVAQANYKKLIEMSTITVTDYSGTQTMMIDTNRMKAIIDNTIANQYQGLVPPKNYGNNNYNNSNPGRTTQADAERIAAQHAAQAAQSSISAEEHAARIEAELALLEAAQQYQ